ncbi:MAG: hypothetical protein HQL66_03350 [Magnetococcales bacterium]|nr:hypothetical protein [Magnetococcales bacterium]
MMYFRLIFEQLETDGIVKIDPGPGQPLAAAAFRTGPQWPGRREQDPDRWHQIWAPVGEEWRRPTREQMLGLAMARGGRLGVMATEVGTTSRALRYWMAEDEEKRHPLPWSVWRAMLAGLLGWGWEARKAV